MCSPPAPTARARPPACSSAHTRLGLGQCIFRVSLSHELSYSAPQQPAPSALARPAGVGLTDQSASMITSTHACNTDAVRSSSSMASSDSSFAVDGVGRVECSAAACRLGEWSAGRGGGRSTCTMGEEASACCLRKVAVPLHDCTGIRGPGGAVRPPLPFLFA
jgi:hypothetical protein